MVFKKPKVREFRRHWHWHNMNEPCARFEGAEQHGTAWTLTDLRGTIPQWVRRFQFLAVPVGHLQQEC
jgi:hypothetical protein